MHTGFVVVVASTCLAVAIVLGSAGAGMTAPADDFFVEGEVYCDTCHAGFVMNAMSPIAGAKVRLECRHFMSTSGAVERSAEGIRDAAGKYRIKLVDNRGSEEVCTVALVSSPVLGCTEKETGSYRVPVALLLDANLATTVRQDQLLPICNDILKSLAFRTAPSY